MTWYSWFNKYEALGSNPSSAKKKKKKERSKWPIRITNTARCDVIHL
jgi:hypothetical protein